MLAEAPVVTGPAGAARGWATRRRDGMLAAVAS